MAQQTINTGSTNNDGTGDTIRAAGTKINANFTEVYGDIATLQTTTTGLVNANHISNVVDDTTPQLGGNLDTNGNNITGTGDINLADGDSGFVVDTSAGSVTINGDGTNSLTFQNPAFANGIGQVFSMGSFGSLTIQAVDGGSITLQPEGNLQLDYSIWPVSDGTNGQVLTTNGSGALSWTDKTALVDLTGYATETWVNEQGFLVAGDVAGEIDLSGYALISYVDQEVANIAFTDIQSKPTTLAGYGITDAATSAQGTNADTAFGWGNHADANYLTSETDSQTLSWDQANNELTISNGNTVELTGIVGGVLFDETSPTLSTDLNANTHSIDNVEFVGGIDGQQMFINAGGANVNPTSGENLIMIGWATTVSGYNNLELNIPDAAGSHITLGTTSIKQKWPKLTQQPAVDMVLATVDAAGTLDWVDPNDIVNAPAVTVGANDLTDVDTTGVSVGDVLKWDGSNWTPNTDSTSVSSIDDIGDVDVSSADVGNVLKYDGSNWVAGTDATSSSVASISDIGDVNITTVNVGQVLKWTGSAWQPSNDNAGSSIANIDDISDVDTTGVVDGSYLRYNSNSSNWEVGTQDSVSVALNDITDVTISSVQEGQFISYADGSWGNSTLDLSSYVQSSSSIDAQPIKQLYSNTGQFPSASTWHGAIAHSHADGAMYFAHNNVWNKLANDADIPTVLTDLGITDGTNGQVLSTDGAGNFTFVDQTGGGGATVAGANTQIQFNNSGALGASTDLTFDDTSNTLSTVNVEADSFTSTGTGIPTVSSSTKVVLQAPDRVEVQDGFFKLPLLSNAAVALKTPTNGDMYYNTDDNTVYLYIDGGWSSLSTGS